MKFRSAFLPVALVVVTALGGSQSLADQAQAPVGHVHGRSTGLKRMAVPEGLRSLYVSSRSYREATDLDERDRVRAEALQHDRIFDIVKIVPGMTVGDLGAGDGYFTFLLASKVGSSGKVYAQDISTKALALLKDRASRKGVSHVETVLGTDTDPKLPAGRLDAAFMMVAFHEVDRPIEFLRNLLPSLKPGGKLVIIDPDNDADYPDFHSRDRKYYYETFDKSPFKIERLDTTTLPVDGESRMAVWVLSARAPK